MVIVIIPFVFWGMGSSFFGGNTNIVVVIGKEKYTVQEFSNFINSTATKKVEVEEIDEFLSDFISEKLIDLEIKNFGIKLSDKSLSNLIKHQKTFKRNGEFSRIEYEKFLLEKNITAVNFESIISKEEKKKQLLDFISGGLIPPKFLVNITYDKVNQNRNIELINLNDVYKKKLNFSTKQINDYYEKNKNKYIEIYKSIKLLELNPSNLVGDSEFNDLFFKKIDEIDDLIIVGEKLDNIIQKFNLPKPKTRTINESGKNLNAENSNKISKDLVKKIFNLNDTEPTVLLEDNNNFFIVELIGTKNVQMNIKSELMQKKILLDLGNETKRKMSSQIIDKINKNSFKKFDFDKLSKDESVKIQKINLQSRRDDKILKKEIVNQIYAYPEKKIIVVSDLGFSENYLIYIDKIESAKINEESNEYKEYENLSRARIVSGLYNTYDNYIKTRYKIDINYKALDIVKNYFN